MVYEHPFVVPGSTEYLVLHDLEIALTAIFGVEALIKIIAYGFVKYIRQVTNAVDLLIVVTSVLLLVLETVASNLQVSEQRRAWGLSSICLFCECRAQVLGWHSCLPVTALSAGDTTHSSRPLPSVLHFHPPTPCSSSKACECFEPRSPCVP